MLISTDQFVRVNPLYRVCEGGEYEVDDLVMCYADGDEEKTPIVQFRAGDVAYE